MGAAGIAHQGAFLEREVTKIEWHALFLQYPVDDGKGGIGQVDAGLERRLMPAQAVGFLLHQTLGFFAQHEVQASYIEGGGHIGVRSGGRLGGQGAYQSHY